MSNSWYSINLSVLINDISNSVLQGYFSTNSNFEIQNLYNIVDLSTNILATTSIDNEADNLYDSSNNVFDSSGIAITSLVALNSLFNGETANATEFVLKRILVGETPEYTLLYKDSDGIFKTLSVNGAVYPTVSIVTTTDPFVSSGGGGGGETGGGSGGGVVNPVVSWYSMNLSIPIDGSSNSILEGYFGIDASFVVQSIYKGTDLSTNLLASMSIDNGADNLYDSSNNVFDSSGIAITSLVALNSLFNGETANATEFVLKRILVGETPEYTLLYKDSDGIFKTLSVNGAVYPTVSIVTTTDPFVISGGGGGGETGGGGGGETGGGGGGETGGGGGGETGGGGGGETGGGGGGSQPPTPPIIQPIRYRFPCFKEDTRILTKNGYVPIQSLRKGDLVKTFKNDYKPIDMIGVREINHISNKQRIKEQLYVCRENEYPEIFEDLIITGCHSILVDNFTDETQKEKTIEVNGKIYITDKKYRLPACLDHRASVYENPGNYNIYHIALEHESYYMNYGIYANGLLVESCSRRYMKEESNMSLIE